MEGGPTQGSLEEIMGTITQSRLRRATSLSTREADAAQAERPLGEAHFSGAVGQKNNLLPISHPTGGRRLCRDFLKAPREEIPCKAQGVRCKGRGSPQPLSGSPSPSSPCPLRGDESRDPRAVPVALPLFTTPPQPTPFSTTLRYIPRPNGW